MNTPIIELIVQFTVIMVLFPFVAIYVFIEYLRRKKHREGK